MAPRSVVMVSPNFHPYVGGAEKQALELSKALQAAGIRVRILTRRKAGLPRWEMVSGIEVRRLAAWGKGVLDSLIFMAATFWWLVRHREEYHVVHVHLAGSPALAAAAAGRIVRRGVIVKVGGGRGIGELAASHRKRIGRMKLRALAALRPQFAAVTKDLVAEMAEYGLGKAPVVVIPNGVDTERYHPVGPEERAALRTALGWPNGICFLYVGRLSPEKRLDHFMDVFGEISKESSGEAFFAVIGAGPEEAGLRERARSAGMESRWRLHAPSGEVAGAYSAADVFVLPSISEGLSNALLEAMSSGCAALASKVGGTPEAVEDGASGLLFDPWDRKALKAGLLKFIREPALARDMGRRARGDAVARFDLSAVAGRYIELYRSSGGGG